MTTDFLLAPLIGLTWFLCVNTLASLVVAAVAPVALRWGALGQPQRLARTALTLRVFPGASAVVFLVVLFIPSFLLYEPQDSTEQASVLLAAVGGLAAVVIGAAIARGVRAWRRANETARGWLLRSHPLQLGPRAPAAFTVEDDTPAAALVGVLRPRLFFGQRILAALSPAELDAAVAHEQGHVAAHDNLKRLAMRACPDLLSWTPIAARIDRAWSFAAEQMADGYAAAGGPERAVDLASALVKAVRLGATPALHGCPASSFNDGVEIAVRVQRLLDGRAARATHVRPRGLVPGITAIVLGAALAIACFPAALVAVHHLTETLVEILG